MTPPPIASPSIGRAQPSGTAPGLRQSAPARPRVAELAIAAAASTSTTSLECAWRIARTGELVLRLPLPQGPSAVTIGELVFEPGNARSVHPLVGAQTSVAWSTARRWTVEARSVGAGEFELALGEPRDDARQAIHAFADASRSSDVHASLALIVRTPLAMGGNAEDVDARAATQAAATATAIKNTARSAPLILTSIPLALGIRGGTYVLRHVAVSRHD